MHILVSVVQSVVQDGQIGASILALLRHERGEHDESISVKEVVCENEKKHHLKVEKIASEEMS